MTNFIPNGARPCNNTFIITVTPELAKTWLEINNFNRPKNPETVARYVRQIHEDRWKLTHQGIAFTKNGFLLDGQHRLFAIIESGVSVPMRVCINESIDNYDVIDCGRNRSHLDVVRMRKRDSTITSAHTLTLKAMLAGFSCRTANRWSNAEIHEFYEKHSSAVVFTVQRFREISDRQINDPTVRGVVARAYYHVAEESLETFCDLLNGRGNHPSLCAVHALMRCLRAWPDRRENTKREIYRRCELTMEAFLANMPGVGFGKPTHELFPLPEEK